MSRFLWCDPGDHPFKAGTPGSAHFQGTQTDQNGAQQTLTQDVCPEHNPYATIEQKENAERKRLTREAAAELLDRGE